MRLLRAGLSGGSRLKRNPSRPRPAGAVPKRRANCPTLCDVPAAFAATSRVLGSETGAKNAPIFEGRPQTRYAAKGARTASIFEARAAASVGLSGSSSVFSSDSALSNRDTSVIDEADHYLNHGRTERPTASRRASRELARAPLICPRSPSWPPQSTAQVRKERRAVTRLGRWPMTSH